MAFGHSLSSFAALVSFPAFPCRHFLHWIDEMNVFDIHILASVLPICTFISLVLVHSILVFPLLVCIAYIVILHKHRHPLLLCIYDSSPVYSYNILSASYMHIWCRFREKYKIDTSTCLGLDLHIVLVTAPSCSLTFRSSNSNHRWHRLDFSSTLSTGAGGKGLGLSSFA